MIVVIYEMCLAKVCDRIDFYIIFYYLYLSYLSHITYYSILINVCYIKNFINGELQFNF